MSFYNGKVVVVTGAGGVLCSVLAQALAQKGAKVALLGRTFDKLQCVADEIISQGGVAKAYVCDVLDEDRCIKTADQVMSDLGSCDLLINGAGGNHPKATTDHEFFPADPSACDGKSLFNMDIEAVSAVFDLNYMGALIPTRVFSQQMLGKSGCAILNISSMNAYTPLTKIPAYSGAKAAVSNLTQWMAVYFSKTGIRVNAIAPGFFSTKQNATLLWNEDGTPTARTEKILSATPMGRFGKPEELIGATLFLLNADLAGFVTGTVLPVDGGYNSYHGV